MVLQSAPGITPALVERIVASRSDLTKADIKEVRGGVSDQFPCYSSAVCCESSLLSAGGRQEAIASPGRVECHLV